MNGLTVKGAITFDGEGELDQLIAVEGACPGLLIEGASLTGFKRAAVQMRGCSGEADRPITLKDLRFNRRGAEGAITLAPGKTAEPTQHIRVEGCRFEGPFTIAAIQIDGPLRACAFHQDRFYQASAAFRVAGAAPLQLTLTNDTFVEMETLFQFHELPAAGDGDSASAITLSAVLLARTPALLRGGPKFLEEKLKPFFMRCKGNVRDRESAKGAPAYLGFKEMVFELSTAAAEEQFLRYLPSSDLATAGPNGTPVGMPPR
jgi:hypothetical protein